MKPIKARCPICKHTFDQAKSLTDSEMRIVNELVKGLSNKEIGLRLNLAYRTVAFHLGRIYKKTGCKGRIELIMKYGSKK